MEEAWNGTKSLMKDCWNMACLRKPRRRLLLCIVGFAVVCLIWSGASDESSQDDDVTPMDGPSMEDDSASFASRRRRQVRSRRGGRERKIEDADGEENSDGGEVTGNNDEPSDGENPASPVKEEATDEERPAGREDEGESDGAGAAPQGKDEGQNDEKALGDEGSDEERAAFSVNKPSVDEKPASQEDEGSDTEKGASPGEEGTEGESHAVRNKASEEEDKGNKPRAPSGRKHTSVFPSLPEKPSQSIFSRIAQWFAGLVTSPSASGENLPKVQLYVMIKSARKNKEKRDSCRGSWLQRSESGDSVILGKMAQFFVIGKAAYASEAEEELERALEEEAVTERDILRYPGYDLHRRLSYKVMWSMAHAAKTYDFDFMLLANDDVFVNYPQVFRWMRSQAPKRVYAGDLKILPRNERAAKYVSTYHRGAGYFLSRDLVQAVTKEEARHSLFRFNEDVCVSMLLKASRIPIHTVRLAIYVGEDVNSASCCKPAPLIIGNVKADQMQQLTEAQLKKKDGSICLPADESEEEGNVYSSKKKLTCKKLKVLYSQVQRD